MTTAPLARTGAESVLGSRLSWPPVLGSRAARTAVLCALATALALYHAHLRYWLCDDAYISFRYARQLTDGYGLVFNRGERVEGYTNFLWVLEVASGMMLGLSPETTSLALSVVATVALFAVIANLVRGSPLSPPSVWPPVLALLLLAANRSIAVWTTSGLETRQFTLFSVLSVVSAGAALRRWTRPGAEAPAPGRFAALHAMRFELAASLFAALSEATRPEGGLVFACVGAAYVALGPALARVRALLRGTHSPGARDAVNSALAVVLPALLMIGVHYVFRRMYYGDWLPNTYYAKHVRPWPESGDKYFTAAGIEHGAYLLVPLAAMGTLLRAARGDLVHLVAWALLVPHALYVRQIGGDHFEFRPLDLHWPLLTAMAVDALVWLGAAFRHRTTGVAVVSAAWLVLLEYTTVMQRAFENETRGRATTRGATYKLRGHVKADSTPEIRFVMPRNLIRKYNDASFYCVDHQSCTRQGEHRAYWQLLEREFGPYRSMTREEAARSLPDNLIWARDAVGFAPYVLPNVTVIDLYGLTDRTIARNPVATPNDRRVMAHDRSPPPGYLNQRGINIQIGAASRSLGEALRHGYWAVPVRPDLWIPFRTYDGDWVVEHFKHRHVFSQFWFDPAVAMNNRGWVDGRYTHGVAFLGRFDDGLDGFTAPPGGAVRVQATASAPPDLQALGAGFLTTEHPTAGARGVGRAVSRPFTARGILAFVLAGGGSPAPFVRLLRDGMELHVWTARGSRVFELQTLDLAPFQGQTVTLEVVDEALDGSVSVDQIMLVEPDARGA